MKTTVEIITPERAAHDLEKLNPVNREITQARVMQYATDMKNGRWLLTHQGLGYYDDGTLYDGQHRLWAVVMSGVSVEMSVTRNVPRSFNRNGMTLFAQDVTDSGAGRLNSQQMRLSHSIKNASQVNAGIRHITALVLPALGRARLSMSNAMEVYGYYGRSLDAVIGALATKKRAGFIVGPLAIYHNSEPDKALEFVYQISTLERLSSPARAFQKHYENGGNAAVRDSSMRVLANCLHCFHRDQPCERPSDRPDGRGWLVSLDPQLNGKIRNLLKPIAAMKQEHAAISAVNAKRKI